MVWLESPTNPLLRVVDIDAVSEVAHSRGAIVCVDNTFATPYLQQPLHLGADVVVHSSTKYIGGHSDVVGGAMMTSNDELETQLRFHQNAVGAVPSPFDCWLLLRGVKTLALRVERQSMNAMEVASALQYVKSGRLRALAVTTPKRIAAAPDVPTVRESGYPSYEVTNWHGLVGPKGLSKDIVERLNKEANEALKSKDAEKVLAGDGLEPAGGSAAEFAVILKNEVARWGEVVRQAKVKVD